MAQVFHFFPFERDTNTAQRVVNANANIRVLIPECHTRISSRADEIHSQCSYYEHLNNRNPYMTTMVPTKHFHQFHEIESQELAFTEYEMDGPYDAEYSDSLLSDDGTYSTESKEASVSEVDPSARSPRTATTVTTARQL